MLLYFELSQIRSRIRGARVQYVSRGFVLTGKYTKISLPFFHVLVSTIIYFPFTGSKFRTNE
jgi:hypothetical protein